MSEKPITITLDRERTLEFDTNAIVLAEKETGKNLLAIVKDLGSPKTVRITDIRALLWAGASHEDPDLTIEAAGRLLKRANTRAVLEAIMAGLADFFGAKG